MPNLSARERSRAEDKGGLLYLGMEMFRTRPSARINNSGGATIAPAKVMTTEVSVGTSWRRLTIHEMVPTTGLEPARVRLKGGGSATRSPSAKRGGSGETRTPVAWLRARCTRRCTTNPIENGRDARSRTAFCRTSAGRYDRISYVSSSAFQYK